MSLILAAPEHVRAAFFEEAFCPSRKSSFDTGDERILGVFRETPGEREIAARRERVQEVSTLRRLWAAVVLCPSLAVCEALAAGVPVNASRLDPTYRRALKLRGNVTLDEALALRVNAHGPLDEADRGR